MPNELKEAMPRILALGMRALREYCVMPRLVNKDYSDQAKEKGDTVDIIIPSAIQAQDVQPGYVPPPGSDLKPRKIPLTLDNWKEAAFDMTDKDFTLIEQGILPMEASEAVRALANAVNVSIFSLYKKIYGFAGIPGTTPFAVSTIEAQDARKVLAKQVAPINNRHIVLDVNAEANAVGLPQFQSADRAGTDITIREGQVGRKLGFDWWLDQNVLTHAAGAPVNGWFVDGAGQMGNLLHIDHNGAGNPANPVEGDVFAIAGSSQTYTVISASGNFNDCDVTIAPAIATPPADNAALTFKQNHVVNLAFQRDCFAFASRPLLDVNPLGNLILSMGDTVSGLTLRLEVSRWHKKTRYSYDILWGVACPRPEFGCRIAG